MRKTWGDLCLAVALTAGVLSATPVTAQVSQGDGDLRVMTYNLDQGTDFAEVSAATNLVQFLVAVGQTITQVRATNPPQRMQAVAQQIINAGPELVSVQELSQWYTGPVDPSTGKCRPVTVEFDMMRDLLDALALHGAVYELAVQAQQLAVPPIPGFFPPSTCVQVINHVAILARTDLDAEFKITGTQSGHFQNFAVLQSPLGPVPDPRAWVSVDAIVHGKMFRFIGTHLDSGHPDIRRLQAAELRAGPAKTDMRVIVAMDSNSRAAPPPADPTYVDFITAGYDDAWSKLSHKDPGLTCCQAPLVNNPVSQLSERIDLILTRGEVKTQRAAVFGATVSDMTPGGLWPADHAGVAAQIALTGY